MNYIAELFKFKADVVYDANFSVRQHRGMGKYVNNFMACVRIRGDLMVMGLLKGDAKEYDRKNYFAFGRNNYVLWEQLSMLRLSNAFKGIIFYPYNTAPLFLKKSFHNVLILHDLIYMNDYKTGSFVQKIGIFYRRFVVPRIVHKFEHIVTVSEYSKTELLKYFNVDPLKVVVIPNAIAFCKEDIAMNPAYEKRENYILHIGGEPQYKNSMVLLYAFHELPEEVKKLYKLKIIGIRNKKALAEYSDLANALRISSQVEFLTYQTDDDIVGLYRNAKMFIFPSFYEGFGIPIIEAFKYGCPLLCSASSCFPEIAGNAATYFDPANLQSIVNAIQTVLVNNNDVKSKVIKGYKQVEEYSLNVFEEKVMTWYKSRFEK